MAATWEGRKQAAETSHVGAPTPIKCNHLCLPLVSLTSLPLSQKLAFEYARPLLAAQHPRFPLLFPLPAVVPNVGEREAAAEREAAGVKAAGSPSL